MKALYFHVCLGLALLCLGAGQAPAQTRSLRIVTYNIEADINGATTPLPGLIAPPASPGSYQSGGVLEGIGEEVVNGNAQPLDILALQETTSNSQTVAPIVTALNAFYGLPGQYTNSPYQATESGNNPADGNGPNALVYNTRTVQLLASTPVNPAGGTSKLGSASGEYRQVMRYAFAPAGVTATASNTFYVYVSHYKSGTTSSDLTARTGEAQIIRTNEAIDLPAGARVIYVGDYNITTSGENSYQVLLASAAPNGIVQGGGIDPANTNDNQSINWGASTSNPNILAQETEHSYALEYRDDLQVMTTNIYFGAPGGLAYLPGSYHAFGNNGTVAYRGSVAGGSDTALAGRLATNGPVFIPAAQLFQDLTNASDHLPVVADYLAPLPAPAISSVSRTGTNLVFTVTNSITNSAFTLLMSPSLTAPLTNWTALAAGTATSGTVAFAATNAIDPTKPSGFFILREN